VSTRGLRTPFLRMARQGRVLDAKRFTRPGGAGAEIADQVADDKVLREYAEGATLVLQGLHRTWPPLVDFGAQLAADLGHPVQVNAYVTPPSSRGFDAHYDVHDVFVLQVSGEKRWMIHPPVHADPLRTQPWEQHQAAVDARAAEEPALDTVLRPGDALYLPRGWLHSAEALGDTSIHLTVGIHALTRYALVEALLALAADTPELRASLPLGVDLADPDALAADLKTTVEALTERLAQARPADVAPRLRTRLEGGTRPEPVRPLAQAAAAAAADATTAVRRRAHLRYRLERAGDDTALRLPDRTLTLPGNCHDAVRALLDGGVHRVGELPGLDTPDAVVLVRRLLRESVVVPGTT
jgi:lysine-specific demethylase/histidyl-hydroxylase NO66